MWWLESHEVLSGWTALLAGGDHAGMRPKENIANMQGKKRKHVPDPGDEMQLTSPLASMLLNKFCWGRISACEVQQYAAAAMMSGASGQDLHTLAKLGGSGFAKQNCHRDLVRAFFGGMSSPQPVQVATVVRVKNAEGLVLEKEKDLPVILPEAWVDTLQNKNLLQELTCSQKTLKEFWLKQDWKNNPQLQCWKSFWKKVRGNSMLEFEDKFCLFLLCFC